MASKDLDGKELNKNVKQTKDNLVDANKAAEKLKKNLEDGAKAAKDIKPGGGGGGGSGSGGGPANSSGQTMPGPTEITVSLPKQGVGLGEFINFAGGMLSGLGQFQPNVASSMQSAGRYYNASLMGGTGATRNGVAAATFGGMSGGLTSQGADAMVANMLTSSGMSINRGVYGQTVAAVGNAAKYLNMDNVTAAQAISGLTSGMGSGNMLRQFGIYTSDLTTGKEKTQGQIFEELAQRLTSGRPGATVEETLDSLRRGNLGESLRNSGLTDTQQALFKQFMVNRAQGIGMDLSDSEAMKSLIHYKNGLSVNPLSGMMQMESDQTAIQNSAQDNYIGGVNAAASSLRGLAGAAGSLAQMFGAVTAFAQTIMGNQQVKALTTMAGASIDLISSGIKAKESANPILMDMAGNLAIGVGTAGLAATVVGGTVSAISPPVDGTDAAPGMSTGSGGSDLLGAVNNSTGPGSSIGDPLSKLDPSTRHGESAYGNNGEVLTTSHRGIDYKASEGTPVYAVADGRVIEFRKDWKKTMTNSTYGNYVRLDHGKNSKGKTVETVYAHLKSVFVSKVGDTVKKGQMIGKTGKTGRVSGPHLHYEVFVDGKSTNPDTVKDIGQSTNSALDKSQMAATSSMFSALSNLFSGDMQTMQSGLQSLMSAINPGGLGAKFELNGAGSLDILSGGSQGAVPNSGAAIPPAPPKVEINVSVNGTEDEALKFAKLVKAYLENNQLSSNMGSF